MRDFEPAIIIPILIFMIPIVAILTSHQQKMAKLIQGGQQDNQVSGAIMHELQSLRAEVANLREVVNHQALAVDDLRSYPRPSVPDRLTQEN
ncbi:MAG: hypothetical protein ACKVQS_03650 [Fimbriimonadaceae bacterium]